VPEDEQIWASLYAAIAQRDAAQIVKFGPTLIANQRAFADDLSYLTTVTAAAYVRLGEDAQAHRLLQAQWARLKHAGQFDLALRDVLALTGAPRARTREQAAP
jgi:hypothetical protein